MLGLWGGWRQCRAWTLLWKHVWVMRMPPIFAGALMFITAPDGYLFCLFCFFPPRYLVIYPYSPLVGRFKKILVWSCGATNTAGFGEHTHKTG
jgi:hypothetical protein